MTHDAVRGALLLVVILDHNDLIRSVASINNIFRPLTFHVMGFLLLPFLSTPKKIDADFIVDRAVRYLVPFSTWLVVYMVAYQIFIQIERRPQEFFQDFALAVMIGSAETLKEACGFIVLWFLPALFSTVLLLALVDSFNPALRRVAWVLSAVAHCIVGAAPAWLTVAAPQGILIAAYVLPLGMMVRRLAAWSTFSAHPVALGASSAVGLAASWAVLYGLNLEVATLTVPTLAHPLLLIASDVNVLSAVTLLLSAKHLLAHSRILVLLGRYSLIVYLAHPLIYKPTLALCARLYDALDLSHFGKAAVYWTLALVSVAFVSAVSVALAYQIRRWPLLRQAFTPRDWGEWLPVALWRAHSSMAR